MIGQKSITSFFSPTNKKRDHEEPKSGEDAFNAKNKRLKAEGDALETAACPLSPEQLQKIAQNKRAALERLSANSCPQGVGESWRRALSAEFTKPYFKQLMNFVAEERQKHTVYPPPLQVFTWTQMCEIKDVKVVVLGQDPYHGPNQAHGLCFSVQKPVPPPPSLSRSVGFSVASMWQIGAESRDYSLVIKAKYMNTDLVNMYKELEADIEGFQHPGHGDLTGWAKQGVLLLNAVLTVRAHQANSHKDKGWEMLTDAVVHWLSLNQEGLVFMLWGAYAQKKGASIDRKRHHVLQTVHPSPLSAHRGFFGCKHFSKTNELLKKAGKKPIDWTAL
ncbi:uracil-DNA glycosylase-like isoform X2 [Hoplias malabaricus]|uniref:uracil-DNA glycosylase-like isoform X2 n=1 Tax=Hoplias malabaricus TaxID=27720 RepID=UPI003461F5FE